jgi:predicted Rossmann fold nucleotide-binding protein DprA/Smf involved in DNA uptake
MIDFDSLSPDAPAIILLCSSVGTDRSAGTARPLGPRTWAKLAEGLRRQSFRGPRDLVGLSADEIDRSLGVGVEEATRYFSLLARGGQLAFEIDRLRSRGIWVLTIADDAYPTRLADRLGVDAPPVLFGSGDASALDRGGIAIVGSREADDAAVAFTERLASAAARGGTPVVSGGARGIDVSAMRAALAAGGTVIGVLPEGVERRLRDADTRVAVASGQVVLVSPYQPAAPFSAGAAMGRNKLIYALADVAVVVSSATGSGGTWTGALEAIKGGWVPVLIRDGEDVPDGNRALIQKGGSSLPTKGFVAETVSVADLLGFASVREQSVAETSAPYEQQALFDE